MLTVVPGDDSDDEGGAAPAPTGSLIDEIVREGARRMLAEALRAEVDAYIAAFTGELDENGRRLVVRNGYHAPREVQFFEWFNSVRNNCEHAQSYFPRSQVRYSKYTV